MEALISFCKFLIDNKSIDQSEREFYSDGSGHYDIQALQKAAERKKKGWMDVEELYDIFSSFPRWEESGGKDVSLREVIEDEGKSFPHHFEDVIRSDISQPILIHEETRDIVDGMHRLGKCHILKRKRIAYRMISSNAMKKARIT